LSDTGHWNCSGLKLDPVRAIGFVYLIVENDTNKKYIGKKHFKGRGKLNKGVPSNWKTYSSSSKYLVELIKKRGKDAFSFYILDQYFTLGGLSFAETWSQVFYETPSNNDEFMNRFIDKVTFKVLERVSKKHRARLKSLIKKHKFEKVEEIIKP
jgi:hypothetical protein